MNLEKLTTKDMALSERKVLHDIANQLVIAQGMSSFLKRSLEKNEPLDLEKENDRVEKLMLSISKMMNIVTERREILYALSAEDS